MQAVILAAGEGMRVRPLTRSRPKALIPVANRPILEYAINGLLVNGIRDIIVVVGYRKEHVIRYLNTLDVPVKVVVQEKQLGTGHALNCARHLVKEDFLVIPGDNYIDSTSLRRVIKEKNAMLVKNHPYPSNFGVVEIRNGMVEGVVEKPEVATGFTISTGVLSLTPDFFNYIESNDITDAVNAMLLKGGKIKAIPADDWQDAIYPWDLLTMNRRLIKSVTPRKAGTIGKNAVITGDVKIGQGTDIGPNTVIEGPVIIGEDCRIGPFCTILSGSSIGSRVTIEPYSMIGNSIIMNDVTIGSHSRVRDAVIGDGTVLKDHVSVSLSQSVMEIEGTLMKVTFGAIIGDKVSAGPHTTFEGAIVGNNVSIRGGKRIVSTELAKDSLMVM